MSIRRTIESLLDDEQQQEAFRASPETFFADHGIEDIPGELIGTAFVHYSDTAPIEHGDAVAGIATHYGPVPFEPDDLPGLGLGEGEESDPFASLGLHPEDLSGAGAEIPDENDVEAAADAELDDTPEHDPELDETGLDQTGVEETGLETGEHAATVADDVDSAGLHDEAFDGGFDDGFDEAEALENNESGFGDGVGVNSGPSEILGEIHGGGPLDPGLDDPFFEEVTDDGLPIVQLEFEPIDFEATGLDHQLEGSMDSSMGHDISHDSFTEHGVETYDDVDPSDLDIDDF